MKTHQFFLLPLLLLTGFLAADNISPNETKPKKAKLPKIKMEKAVLLLRLCSYKLLCSQSNFDRVLKETKLLKEFCECLSQSSQNSSEEFAEAALQPKKEAPRICGKINVTHQHDLRKNLIEFPTVKFFVCGSREDPIDCKGKLQASAFITWVKRRTGPSTVLINSTDQAEAINADNLAVTGFFKELHNDSVEVFCEMVRDVPEMLSPFKTSVKIFEVPAENHILLFTPTNSETFNAIYENYKCAAGEFRGKIMFTLVDTNETRNGQVFEYFCIREVDIPAIRIVNLTSNAKYKMPADELTVENLKFCQSYLNGKAKLHLSIEEIPENWDKMPVKFLVENNFNRIVFNKTMIVFVMFYKCYCYVPWSYGWRKLLPIWDKLGKQYESHKDIIIVKTDVTANDSLSVGSDHYPFFRLFPAGPDYQEVAYAREHTLEAFSEFLEEQSKTKAEPGQKVGSFRGIEEDLGQKETVITEKEQL
ncbi:LOW QUALITY PROTEIN: protein disulfide-isomerase-like protein of the testis [Cariama cristata]